PTARYQPARQRVRPSVQRLLDSMTNTAAFVRNGRLDILAANQLGYALYSPVFDSPVSGNLRRPANLARFIFLDNQSAQFYRDRELPADPGQTIITYIAEPGSTARDALDILASWAATHHQTGQLDTTHPADGHAAK